MRIGIVGGGLSAYLLAYRLRGYGYSIDIYEDGSNPGGNCHTTNVDVPGSASPSQIFARWADLAVNDFNAPMYRDVVDIMDALGVTYAPLEDTAAFYSTDRSVQYTLDGGWGTPAPEEFEHLYAVFAARAWDVMNTKSYLQNQTSVGDFLKETPFAAVPEFGEQCILPRVNAMYFCSPDGPAAMPIQTAYFYYLFQEGFGTDGYASPNGSPSVNRQYFLNGASSFVAALKQDAVNAGVNIFSGPPATVAPCTPSGAATITQGTTTNPYDKVVLTIHANDAATALGPSFAPDVLQTLTSVNYALSTAIIHQDPSLLPDPGFRRTYNVLVRGPSEPTTYSMTYVINQHQADRENTNRDLQYFDCDEYYVSLDPVKTPANILIDKSTGQPAVYPFWHNVGDVALQQAQAAIWSPSPPSGGPPMQGRGNIYFTGGWTTGAGLMIECWEAVQHLMRVWSGEPAHAVFDASRPEATFAPSYIRRLRPPKSRVSLNRRTKLRT